MAAIAAKVILSVSFGSTETLREKTAQTGAAAQATEIADCISSLPLLASDQDPIVSGQTYPIRVPATGVITSAERAFRVKLLDVAKLDGGGDNTDSRIRTIKVWQSTVTPSGETGKCRLWAKVTGSYVQPSVCISTAEEDAADAQTALGVLSYAQIPTTSGTALAVTISGEVYDAVDHPSSELDQAGEYTDYVYLVLDVESTQTQGGSATIYVSYDEVS